MHLITQAKNSVSALSLPRSVQYLFNRRYDVRAILTRLARLASRTKPFPLRTIRAAESSF
jgi:hypothetical protein